MNGWLSHCCFFLVNPVSVSKKRYENHGTKKFHIMRLIHINSIIIGWCGIGLKEKTNFRRLRTLFMIHRCGGVCSQFGYLFQWNYRTRGFMWDIRRATQKRLQIFHSTEPWDSRSASSTFCNPSNCLFVMCPPGVFRHGTAPSCSGIVVKMSPCTLA